MIKLIFHYHLSSHINIKPFGHCCFSYCSKFEKCEEKLSKSFFLKINSTKEFHMFQVQIVSSLYILQSTRSILHNIYEAGGSVSAAHIYQLQVQLLAG
jgi:hypothetical protein